MKTHIQFVTTPTADTPGTAIILQHEYKKYMFGNLAEGTQRACVGHGVRLARLSDIFLTGRAEWSNTGGTIGMILTLADVLHTKDVAQSAHMVARGQAPQPKPVLGLHGPRNLKYTLAAGRRFIFRKGLPLKISEYDREEDESKSNDDPTWTDENIKVWHLPIEPKSPRVQITESPIGTKRSFSELQDESSAPPETPFYQAPAQHNEILDNVIDMMFDSSWSKDKYIEVPLLDNNLSASFFQRNPTTGRIEPYSGPWPDQKSSGSTALKDVKVLVRSAWPGANVETLPTTSPNRTALSYIVGNHPQRGKFLPQKAIALGLKPGTSFKTLASGETVTMDDGTIIRPEMVLEPTKKGRAFAVIDLPSEDYVDNFLARRELASDAIMESVGLFVWILGPGVIHNLRLEEFMESLSHVKHVLSSKDTCPNNLGNDASASTAIKLSQIAPDHFPVPIHSNVRAIGGPVESMSAEQISSPLRLWEPAQRGLRIQVEPAVERDPGSIISFLNTAEVLKETPAEALRLGKEAQQKVSDLKAKAESCGVENDGMAHLPGKYNEIITLGTGSAMPSKYRNVSANLLRIPGKGSYLFDCGEGTLGQLRRMYNPAQLEEVLRDLKMIWISHLHADHHLGTTSVIRAWVEATSDTANLTGKNGLHDESDNKPRLHIVSDRGMLGWIREYFKAEDLDISRVLLVLAEPPLPDTPNMNTLKAPRGLKNGLKQIYSAMQISDFQVAYVSHCHGAMAVSVTFNDGFKISYSGDCRPSQAFVSIGKGSTVLIHEATFDDELREDAINKKHSTTSEAIGVGIAMGARRIILTHFSQRYAKVPVLDKVAGQGLVMEDADTESKYSSTTLEPSKKSHPSVMVLPPSIPQETKVGIAFDLMKVKVGEMEYLENYMPALEELFKDEEIESTSLDEGELGTRAPTNSSAKTQEKSKKLKKIQEKQKTKSNANTLLH